MTTTLINTPEPPFSSRRLEIPPPFQISKWWLLFDILLENNYLNSGNMTYTTRSLWGGIACRKKKLLFKGTNISQRIKCYLFDIPTFSDDAICPNTTLKCPDFYCIELRLRCNGEMDCPNGEDEIGCGKLVLNIYTKKARKKKVIVSTEVQPFSSGAAWFDAW